MMIPSYPKVYNLGHPAIKDLFEGHVVTEEKIDGSQFSFMKLDGKLHCRSRNKEINIDAPDKMFEKGVEEAAKRLPYMAEGLVYRGEYLQKPKHNTLAYDRVPHGHIVIWDIARPNGTYMPPESKVMVAEMLQLECTPMLSYERGGSLDELLDRQSFLGGQKIEGAVFKNYDRYGADGKFLAGKFVSERFKEVHRKDWKERFPGKKDIMSRIIAMYRTEARWDKAVQHLQERGELLGEPRDIGPLIKEVQEDFAEECADEVGQMLFDWMRHKIDKELVSGVAEWYKRRLANEQR